jgi:hypothetical protein
MLCSRTSGLTLEVPVAGDGKVAIKNLQVRTQSRRMERSLPVVQMACLEAFTSP